ncbi:MAG: glycoside hydrolase, partial [Proteobacteria bacterium]|nr:glycoside hydrolase [Pseudomonadota bacterium]
MAASVAFLWHMHQPYYRNPVGGEYRMPWTFLHAAKDYYDMLRLAVDGDARVTFNLVPSLMDQLEDYAREGVADTFLDPLRVHPSDLGVEAREDLLPRLLFAHLGNQISPLPRYAELHDKVRALGAAAARGLSLQDLLDLEVLFLLAWTGEVVRAEEPQVRSLLAKGREFSQADKAVLLGVLHRLAGRTLDAYREAQDTGAIEISTTPYYHPILPLLLDMESARMALPQVTLPVIQRGFGEDAARHVRDAVTRYRGAFGRPPLGFWPSEGSVSAAALGLLADEGVDWAASDEDVLAASLGISLSGVARAELYRPHVFRSAGGAEIAVFFRDKTLADLVGFTYATWDTELAVRDFAGRLGELARGSARGGTISVILDGENAWEFYRENGAPFLRALYREIAAHPDLHFRTFSECRDGGRLLPRVHAGSWIYGSFSTWIGHPEKNRAWELLERTRCRLEDEEGRLGTEQRELAWREIRIAEGSDWFWWLGDDHYTPLAGEFDQLFRLHLLNVYQIAGLEPPA